MSKPTEQELNMALEHAKHLRETGQDTYYLAKTLLNCNYQMSYLVEVLNAAERFLQSGMDESEHSRLVKAIETARKVDDYSAHREHPELGL